MTDGSTKWMWGGGLSIAVVLATFAPIPCGAAAVVGWRTDGTGAYPEATPPLKWSKDLNVVWAVPMPGWSNSTPVITGDRLFVCSEPSTLVCVQLSDGRTLWQRDSSTQQLDPPEPDSPPPAHGANGYSSCTPVTDGRHVYAVFGNRVAVGYDTDGKRLWTRKIDSPVHDWGHSSSPVLVGDTLVILVKDLVGLDTKTGAEKWRTRSEQRWGTPIHVSIDGVDTVITPNGQIVSVADGKVLADGLANTAYNAPLYQDGVVYFIEGRSHALRLPDRAEDLPPTHLWEGSIPKDRYYASPVLHDGLIYAITRNSQFSVLDAADGKRVYKKKLDLGGGNIFPSIAVAGGHLFVSSENGTTLVLEPGRTYRELARNALEPFRSTPVFQGRRMYIRGLKHLYCIEAGNGED